MNFSDVVVVGKGAREHALQDALSSTANVVVTPGGPGIPGSVNTDPEDLKADLFVIGPEQPLVEGLADRLRAQGKVVLGPGAKDARLEGSKIWMKTTLHRAGVPTAGFDVFLPGQEREAENFLRSSMSAPYVVKTDYLAAGKGVLVTNDLEEAVADAIAKLKIGGIVIECGLSGTEMSFFALCSGTDWAVLPSAQDYKRLLDGDKGPNTGGMGAFSPVPHSPGNNVLDPIIEATLTQLRDYRGILYGGAMLAQSQLLQLLEYNIRFGDPEAQVVLPRIQGDLAEAFYLAATGQPPPDLLTADACVTVVLASEGYPDNPRTGDVITGLEDANRLDGVKVYHGGTALNGNGQFVTAGGRVLSATATAETVPEARDLAYQAVEVIKFRGMQYRTDIAAGVT